mmetsp:Transcript_31011/g.39979  ORF Transcript_31011/g.39979 Transcript_31011/m.39979 type:complete len:131 (-) Transcript_31011:355-747(-)
MHLAIECFCHESAYLLLYISKRNERKKKKETSISIQILTTPKSVPPNINYAFSRTLISNLNCFFFFFSDWFIEFIWLILGRMTPMMLLIIYWASLMLMRRSDIDLDQAAVSGTDSDKFDEAKFRKKWENI